MFALTANKQATRVRVINQGDVRNILRLIDTSWRVHIRISPVELAAKIQVMPGFLVEDHVGLRGFIMIEAQRPNVALIIAAGLRDTWGIRPYLDLLAPEVEHAALAENLFTLVHIGGVSWLTEELWQRGFETREWVVAFERRRNGSLPLPPQQPAFIRSAHRKDLSAILALDGLAFDHIWRKSVGNFNAALASATSFSVAEMDHRVVGYAWCDMYRRHAHLTRLAVHPHYQGYGIGAQLLHQALSDVLAQGADLITLNTQESNNRSQALYERFGFVHNKQRMPVLWKDLALSR